MNDKSIKDELIYLFSEIKTFVELKYNYTKLDFIEKLIVISTLFITALCCLTLFLLFLVFLSIALAYYWGGVFGSNTIGFLVVSGIYFVLFLLLLTFRTWIIYNPVMRFILKIVFHPKKEKPVDETDNS